MNNQRQARTFDILANLFAWVWMLSFPLAAWFLVSAALLHGAWWHFFGAVLAGWIAKNVFYRGFGAHRDRLTLEAQLIGLGISDGQARTLAYGCMNDDPAALAFVRSLCTLSAAPAPRALNAQ